MLCITQKGQMNFPNTKYFFSIWDPYSLWSNNNLNNESSFCNIVWWIQCSWGVAISIQILMRRKLCYVENWVMAVRNSTQTRSPQMKGEQKSSFPCSEVHTHCIRQSWLYKVRDLKQNQGPYISRRTWKLQKLQVPSWEFCILKPSILWALLTKRYIFKSA